MILKINNRALLGGIGFEPMWEYPMDLQSIAFDQLSHPPLSLT